MSKNITFAGNILIASGSHRQFLDNWGDLERYCGYREDNIPQLEDINRHISKSAHQYISESVSTFYNFKKSTGRVDPASPWVVIIFAFQVSSQQDRFPNPTSGWLSLSQVRNRREEKLNKHFDIFTGTSWPAWPSGSSIALSKQFFKKVLIW